jgi:hypothetical protein
VLLIGAIALALFVLPPGWGIAVVTLAAVIEVAEVGFWIRFLRRYRIATGKEALIGSSAEVIEAVIRGAVSASAARSGTPTAMRGPRWGTG